MTTETVSIEVTQVETPDVEDLVDLDAPVDYCIVETHAERDGVGAGQPWQAYYLVRDGNGNVVTARFLPESSFDYTAYATCVPIEDVGSTTGRQTLTAGTATVSTSAVTSNSRIFLERQATGGTTTGNVYHVTARNPGTSFTITAIVLSTGLTGSLDTSTIDWMIVEP